jgi:hypothetical protein
MSAGSPGLRSSPDAVTSQAAALSRIRQRGLLLGHDRNDGEGARFGRHCGPVALIRAGTSSMPARAAPVIRRPGESLPANEARFADDAARV